VVRSKEVRITTAAAQSASIEALLPKIVDSLDNGVARPTAHTAFDDATAPPTARPRRSIELRALLFRGPAAYCARRDDGASRTAQRPLAQEAVGPSAGVSGTVSA